MSERRSVRNLGLLGPALLFTLGALAQGCGLDLPANPIDEVDVGGADTLEVDADPCAERICATGEVCEDGDCVSLGCVDRDEDGFGLNCEAGPDCDDANPDAFPGRPEVCNDVDDDCDLFIDEDGVCAPCNPQCEPGEIVCDSETIVVFCDDSSGCPRFGEPVTCPGAQVCRETGCVDACQDRDGDGFGVDCPNGQIEDCDDTDNAVFPGSTEVCDGVDNNCDSRIDEAFVCDAACTDECEVEGVACTADRSAVTTCRTGPNGCRLARSVACPEGTGCENGACLPDLGCFDPDGDGFGTGCEAGVDCRPFEPASYTGAAEVCDGLDNDCDGVADDGGVCVPCGNAAVAPLTAGETLYARTCGGVIEVALLGLTVGDALAILLGVDGESAPRFEVGLGTGADFAPFEASHAVGEAQALTFVVANETLTLRFVASSAAFSLATAVSGVDRFELNNGPSQAIDLGRLPFAGGASLETGDLDFYRLNPGRGNVLIVEATMLEFTAAFPRIWSGFSEASWPFSGDRGLVSQRTHFRADVPGQMSLGFRTPTGRDTTPIAFRVREWVPPACADDAGDPASGVQDDTVVAARALAGQVSATLCHGDYDVYTLGELDGGTLTLQLTGPNGLGFLLFRDGLQSIRYNSFSAEGGNRITLNVSDPGTYYVVVLGDTPEASGEYRLTSSR